MKKSQLCLGNKNLLSILLSTVRLGHMIHTGNHVRFQKFWKNVSNVLKKSNQNILNTKIHCFKDGVFRKAEKQMSLARLGDNHRRVAQGKVGALSKRDYHNSLQKLIGKVSLICSHLHHDSWNIDREISGYRPKGAAFYFAVKGIKL